MLFFNSFGVLVMKKNTVFGLKVFIFLVLSVISKSIFTAATHGYLQFSGINTSKPTTLNVRHVGLPTMVPKTYTITTNQGNTILLTWGKDNFPRPQTRPLFGILGKTESGLNLSNNINKESDKIVEFFKGDKA